MKGWTRRLSGLIVAVVVLAGAGSAWADDEALPAPELEVGAAVRDVTPTADMLPLWRRVDVTMTEVADPLHVRVIARSSGGSTALLVTTETGRGPYGPQFAGAIAEHAGVPIESVFYTTTHSHAAPEITSAIDLDFEEDDESVTNDQRWGRLVLDQMLDAVDEALASMEPASVGIGYDESHINVNRNSTYNRHDDEGNLVGEYRDLGFDPTGVSDKTVATIQFNDAAGEPIAFIVNYAVHGTVMHGNTIGADGTAAISADIPGLVSAWLEEKHEDSVAVWLSGAAGDQAPIVQNHMVTRDPLTGAAEEHFSDSYDILTYLSRIHFYDIERALAGIEEFSSDVEVGTGYVDDTIPRVGGGDFYVSMQGLRIGDILLAGYPGELFNQLGIDIKNGSALEDTIVVNHTWQRAEQTVGYHADDASIEAGGSATNAPYQAGHISQALVDLTNQLIEDEGQVEPPAWTYHGDGTATHAQTGQTVIVGLDGVAGTSDDDAVVNPAGTVLAEGVSVSVDASGARYVDLGNGFHLYPGADGLLGTTDDVVTGFGSYPQSDATGATADPLNWRLLDIDDGEAILMTAPIVDAVLFNLEATDGNTWADSNLRSWLNSRGGQSLQGDTRGFYDAAFSEEEKERIALTDVRMDYSGHPLWDASPDGYDYQGTQGTYPAYNRTNEAPNFWELYSTTGEDTQDHVFAISGEEGFEYFGQGTLEVAEGWDILNYTNGYFAPTEYAKAQGAKYNTGGNGAEFTGFGDTWTRSPGREADENGWYYGVFWGSTGSMNSGREVSNSQGGTAYGTLPLITVSLGDGAPTDPPDWILNGDGTATHRETGRTVIVGLDGEPGTEDDDVVVNPAGTVLLENVTVEVDAAGQRYVDLGNGFHLYAGADGALGTTDDVVAGFGAYPQSDTTGATADPLDWRLLDVVGGTAVLATSVIVDSVPFDPGNATNAWSESNLRSWLNSAGGESQGGDTVGFYDTAFSAEEKALIVESAVPMSSRSSFIAYNTLLSSDWWGQYSTTGEDTQDHVYALSGEEVFGYFGRSTIATEEELGHDPANYTNAYLRASAYALEQGVPINTGGNGPSFEGFSDSWTRSPGAEGDGADHYGVFLGTTGSLNVGRPVTRQYGALPAIAVALEEVPAPSPTDDPTDDPTGSTIEPTSAGNTSDQTSMPRTGAPAAMAMLLAATLTLAGAVIVARRGRVVRAPH